MVALADLSHASALQGEKEVLTQAITNLNANGPIVNMTIGPELVTVDTSGITYPFQMTSSIVSQLSNRVSAIEKELSDMGVTGLPGEGRATPATAGQPASPARQPAPPRR